MDSNIAKDKKLNIVKLILFFFIPLTILLLSIIAFNFEGMKRIDISANSIAGRLVPNVVHTKRYSLNIENLKAQIKNIALAADAPYAKESYINAMIILNGLDLEDYTHNKGIEQSLHNLYYGIKKLYRLRANLDNNIAQLDNLWYQMFNAFTVLNHHCVKGNNMANMSTLLTSFVDLHNYKYDSNFLENLNIKLAPVLSYCNTASSSDMYFAQCGKLQGTIRLLKTNWHQLLSNNKRIGNTLDNVDVNLTNLTLFFNQNEANTIIDEVSLIVKMAEGVSSLITTVLVIVLIILIFVIIVLHMTVVNPLVAMSQAIERFSRSKNKKVKIETWVSPIKEVDVIGNSIKSLCLNMQHAYEKSDEMSKRYSELLNISYVDDLTGAHNRRALSLFEKTTGFMPAKSCILMIDIDHFKIFNDTEGHQRGDEILKIVAKTLMTHVSSNDFVYRYGGEEFCVLLQNVTVDESRMIAQRLCDEIRTLNIENKGIKTFLTISVGVSPVNMIDGEFSVQKLIEIADKALYEAKHSGRNRVRTYLDIKEN